MSEAPTMTDDRNKLDDATFKQELTALIPHLRAFARSLCRDASLADDLAQDAMLKAWNARDSFLAGTNMKAWAFTILRNAFYSEKRRSWPTAIRRTRSSCWPCAMRWPCCPSTRKRP